MFSRNSNAKWRWKGASFSTPPPPPNNAQILEDGELLVSHHFWAGSALCLGRTSRGFWGKANFPGCTQLPWKWNSVTHTRLCGAAFRNGPGHTLSTIRHAGDLPKWYSLPLSFYISCNCVDMQFQFIHSDILFNMLTFFWPAFSRKPTECGSPSWDFYPSC